MQHDNIQTEIVELHDFFVAWFTGTLPKNVESFARVESALSKAFVIVSPGGTATERKELLEQLHGAYGRLPDIRIWIENVQLRQQNGPVSIVTYEEWQENAGKRTVRLSTVVFCTKDNGPNGLEWLHVHETWRP